MTDEEVRPRTFTIGPSASKERARRAAPPQTPKSVRPTTSKGDLDRALAMMDTLYELFADGLELFGLDETREKWESATTKLRRTNRDSLSASPRLAKQIANFGEGGGATTFFVAHVVAFATLYPTANREMRINMATKAARHSADEPPANFDWERMAEPGMDVPPTTFNAGEYIPGLG